MSQAFEIMDINQFPKCFPIKKAVEKIHSNYPDNLIYRGKPFFDEVYMKILLEFAHEQREGYEKQESYLGWLPDSDTFIEGFDMWEDDGDDVGNSLVFIKIIDNKPTVSHNHYDITHYGMVYGPNGAYEKLHKLFLHLVDIRLD